MNPLDLVTETATRLQKIETLRDKLQDQRDHLSWSLLKHDGWSNPRIRAIFGTSSHNAWTKSRQRMNRLYPDGPPAIGNAELKLVDTVARLRAVDALYGPALEARREAMTSMLKAAPGVSGADISRATGLSRQAVWVEMKKLKAVVAA